MSPQHNAATAMLLCNTQSPPESPWTASLLVRLVSGRPNACRTFQNLNQNQCWKPFVSSRHAHFVSLSSKHLKESECFCTAGNFCFHNRFSAFKQFVCAGGLREIRFNTALTFTAHSSALHLKAVKL